MAIISNKIKCKHCGDIIESTHVHDFKTCKCGTVSVDGGHEYLKRSFQSNDPYDDFEDLSLTLENCPLCGKEADIKISPHDPELKRVVCPSCGASTLWGKDVIDRWNTRKKDKIKKCPLCKTTATTHEAYDGTCCVQCNKCFFTGPYKSTREEAIEAWNRRVYND